MHRLKTSLACLLSGLILLVLAAAAHRGWHQSIHRDAATESHSCLITLFAHAHIDAAKVLPMVALAVFAFAFLQSLEPIAVFSAVDLRSPPGRAPPFSR